MTNARTLYPRNGRSRSGGSSIHVRIAAGMATATALFATATVHVGHSEEVSLSAPIDLALYAELLEQHTTSVPDVVGTRVDYVAIGRSTSWKQLVQQVHQAKPAKLKRNERLAYWINAYNILTIDLVARHYPIDSIKDLGSFFSPVWNKTVATIEGRPISLGFIEHEILRKMSEPRIHAAIVCASTSCPALARSPFRAESVDADLDTAMRVWLASREKGIHIDRTKNRVRLSRIFDWFAEDFESEGGAIAAAAAFLGVEDAEWLGSHGQQAEIDYFDYDWSLNDDRSASGDQGS